MPARYSNGWADSEPAPCAVQRHSRATSGKPLGNSDPSQNPPPKALKTKATTGPDESRIFAPLRTSTIETHRCEGPCGHAALPISAVDKRDRSALGAPGPGHGQVCRAGSRQAQIGPKGSENLVRSAATVSTAQTADAFQRLPRLPSPQSLAPMGGVRAPATAACPRQCPSRPHGQPLSLRPIPHGHPAHSGANDSAQTHLARWTPVSPE